MRGIMTAFVAIALCCTVALAQGEDADIGITLIITPQATYIGGSVTISGATAPAPQNPNVTATFTPPGGQGDTITVHCPIDSATYEYKKTVGPLNIPGTWEVSARSPVTQLGTATGKVIVEPPAAAASTSVQGVKEGLDESSTFTTEAERINAAFTELPDKEEALEKMAELDQNLQGCSQAMGGVSEALNDINGAMDDLAAFPEMQETMTDLASQLEGPVREMESVTQELQLTREQMNNAREWCRRYHFQKYGFKFVLKGVQFAFTSSFSIKAWATDKLKSTVTGVRDKLMDEAVMKIMGLSADQVKKARSALAVVEKAEEVIKTHLDPNGNFSSLKKEAIFKAGDWLIDWIYSKVGKNCRMYDAKVKGKFYCEYYTKRMVYMVAEYPWEGELKVFFKKREVGSDIVKLKGQIQGSFGWRTGKFFPERTCMDVPGMTGTGFCVPRPPFIDLWDFVILLEGEGKPHSIELEVKEVLSDIERLKYMFVGVLWSPYQVVPTVDFPKMDVPGGEWFLTRVTGVSNPDKDNFEIPLKVEGDKVLMKHTFKRTMDYREKNEFRAFLRMEIDGTETGI